MTSETLVSDTKPFRGDNDLIRTVLKNFVVDRDERNSETVGQFLLGMNPDPANH